MSHQIHFSPLSVQGNLLQVIVQEVNKTDLNKARHGKVFEAFCQILEFLLPDKQVHTSDIHKHSECFGEQEFNVADWCLLMKSPKEVVKWNSTLFIILLKCVSSRTLISCTNFKTSIFLLITVVTFTTSFGHCIRVVLFNFFGLPVRKKRLLFPFGSLFMKKCSNAA